MPQVANQLDVVSLPLGKIVSAPALGIGLIDQGVQELFAPRAIAVLPVQIKMRSGNLFEITDWLGRQGLSADPCGDALLKPIPRANHGLAEMKQHQQRPTPAWRAG